MSKVIILNNSEHGLIIFSVLYIPVLISAPGFWRIWPFSELDVIWLPFQTNTDAIESLHTESPLTFKLDHSPDMKPLRDIIWELAYKHLKRNDWKKLAEHWEFTEDQVAAIEEQWTGQNEMLYDQIFYIILTLCSEEPQNKPLTGSSAAPTDFLYQQLM